MHDETENIRRQMVATGQPYKDLMTVPEHMRWTTEQFKIDFKVIAFQAPFVIVQRTADGVIGSMEFTHHPRVYFNFEPEKS